MIAGMTSSTPRRHRIVGAALATALAAGLFVPGAYAARAKTERLSETAPVACPANPASAYPSGATIGSVQATFVRRGDRFQAQARPSTLTLNGLPKGRFSLLMTTTVYAQDGSGAVVTVGVRTRVVRVRVVRPNTPALIRPATFRFSGRVAGLGTAPTMNAMAVTRLTGSIPVGSIDCSGVAAINAAKAWQ